MKIIMSGNEQSELIDIAMREGVRGVKEFDQWLIENRDRILDMFQAKYCVVYGSDVE